MAIKWVAQAAHSPRSVAGGASAARRSIARGESARFSRHRMTHRGVGPESKSLRFFLRLSVSHIVTIKTEVRDVEAVRAACKRLGLEVPVLGTAKLYEGEVAGLLVKLPEWAYPAVVDTATGQVKYDNYNGAWGD